MDEFKEYLDKFDWIMYIKDIPTETAEVSIVDGERIVDINADERGGKMIDNVFLYMNSEHLRRILVPPHINMKSIQVFRDGYRTLIITGSQLK